MEERFKITLFKNFLKIGLYKYSGQLIIFLSSIIVSRLLTPSEYGVVALITVFSSFIISFLDAGFRYSAIRNKFDNEYYQTLQFIVVAFGALLGLIMVVLSIPISWFYHKPDLILPCILFGLIIFSSSIRIIPEAILDKEMQFNITARITLIANLIGIALVIILAMLGFSFWSLIIPQLFIHWIAYFAYKQKINIAIVIPSKHHLKETIGKVKSLAKNVSWFTFFNYWQRNVDNLLIGKVYGEHSLGLYSRAYALLEMPIHLISGVLQQIMFPSFQKQLDENLDIKPDHIDLIKILNIMIFPVPVLLVCLPYTISNLLWGQAWLHVGDFLPVFGTLIILQAPFFSVGPMMVLLKKDKYFAAVGSINASVLIAAIVIGMQVSLMSIVYAYGLAYICFCVPFTAYWGHVRSFSFTLKELVLTLGFEWICSFSLMISIIFSQTILMYSVIAFYGCVKFSQAIIKLLYLKRNLI